MIFEVKEKKIWFLVKYSGIYLLGYYDYTPVNFEMHIHMFPAKSWGFKKIFSFA